MLAPILRIRNLVLLLALCAWAPAAQPDILVGDLIVSDEFNQRILRVLPGTGDIEVVSPRPGQTNHLVGPTDLVITSLNRLFVADAAGNQIVEVDLATGVQSVLPVVFDDLQATIDTDASQSLYVYDGGTTNQLLCQDLGSMAMVHVMGRQHGDASVAVLGVVPREE